MTLIPDVRVSVLSWAIVLLGSLHACHGERAATHDYEASHQGLDASQPRSVDRILSVAIDTLWSLGDLHDERLSLTVLHSNHLTDGRRRLYILDAVARQVHIVNMHGDLIATWGGMGTGPGELMDPRFLGGNEETGVAVVDWGKGAVVAWTAEGDLLPERPFVEPIHGPFHRSGTGDEAIDAFVTKTLERRSRRIVETLLVANSSETMTIASITLPRMVLASFPSCAMRDVLVPPLHSPRLVWDHRQGTTVVSDGVDYQLEIYDRGTHRAGITRNLPPVDVSRYMVRAHLGEGMELGRCMIPADEFLDAAGFQTRTSIIKRMRFADDGLLYVTRTTSDFTSRVDLVSLDSGYIGTLPPGTPAPDAFLGDNEFVSIEQDALGIPVLSAYRMRVAGRN